MSDQPRKRPTRGYAASRFDEVTLAACVVLIVVLIATVLQLGTTETLERIGCGLNAQVNRIMAYPRPCH